MQKSTKLKIWKVITVCRWIYAVFFLIIGAQALLVYAGLLPKTEYMGSPESKEFTKAIFATGFIGPIMSITYFIAGILLVFNRTAPLGLILLAPFILVILFTHIMLNGNPHFGILLFALWLIFALQFLKAFESLWSFQIKK